MMKGLPESVIPIAICNKFLQKYTSSDYIEVSCEVFRKNICKHTYTGLPLYMKSTNIARSLLGKPHVTYSN